MVMVSRTGPPDYLQNSEFQLASHPNEAKFCCAPTKKCERSVDKSSAIAEMGDRGQNRHGRKEGGGAAVPLLMIAGNPSNTKWPGFRTKWRLNPSSGLATIDITSLPTNYLILTSLPTVNIIPLKQPFYTFTIISSMQ